VNCPHCNTPNPDDARFCAACGRATSMTEPSFTGMRAVPDLIGKEIAGRYRILSKLGEGGMGAVYKAEQISLKRQCAVKLLRSEVASTPNVLTRFNAEATACAKLSHPNTVGIYDFGQDTDGTFFIAMEFVEGKSLRETIQSEAPFPIRRALQIASQVAASLTDAHAHSIVHRDLKPDNVMLQTRGRQRDIARVLDFGIAKLRDEGRATQAAMTQAGDMLGTPQYMAPEQIKGEQIDGRTDIYALGCMIYEMVTARLPFEAPTIMAMLSKHLMEMPPSPSQRRPDLGIPPHIDHLVMTAIAKDKNQRPPSMEMFGEQLAAMLAQMPSDSAQGSAQVSAQVGAVGATMPTGPGMPPTTGAPMSYGGQPAFTPPPPPPGAAPGYVTPGVMQQPPGMQGYATPQPGYGYPQGAPPMQSPMPAPGGGSKKGLLIGLGAVVAIGLVVAIVFATRGGGGGTASDGGLEANAGDAGDKPDKIDAGVDEPPPKRVDAKVEEGDDDDDTPQNGSDDPWSENGGGGDTATGEALITAFTDIKTQICACKDMSCAGKAMASAQRWMKVFEKAGGKMPDADTLRRLTALQTEIQACSTKLAGTAVTRPPPQPADLNTQLDQIASRACACTEEDCARRVLAQFTAFLRRAKTATGGDPDRARTTSARMAACMVHAGLEQTEIASAVQAVMN
jgi:eukaryotic-like serine/threonine-protein kinase